MRPWLPALALAVAALASGCGYDSGLRVAEKYRSVGVDFFGNETPERDVERPLYDELTRSLRDLTDVPIESPAEAEVVIRGTVRNYQRRGGVRSRDNVLLETGVLVEAEATLVERSSGRALGPPVRAGRWVGFVLDDPGNEARAVERVLHHIADELVLGLFAPVN